MHREVYSDLQKEKEIQIWVGIMIKSKKDQEKHKKTIIELNGRATKFHKFSMTIWAKAVLQHSQ